MYVHDDREAARQQHVERRVEVTQVVRPELRGVRLCDERGGLHGEPHMVEAQTLDEPDVALGGVRLEMGLGVVAARRLREPVAQVDAAAQARVPPDGDLGRAALRADARRTRQANEQHEKREGEFFEHGPICSRKPERGKDNFKAASFP